MVPLELVLACSVQLLLPSNIPQADPMADNKPEVPKVNVQTVVDSLCDS